MAKRKVKDRFAICVNNDGYPASLELRKVYQLIPDEVAAARGFVRVVDESGEDYLYPQGSFVPIEVPQSAKGVFARAS
jgi:hypothetical protein